MERDRGKKEEVRIESGGDDDDEETGEKEVKRTLL